MRKITLILLTLCCFLSSCRDGSIRYDGPETINIVLRETMNLNATSKDPISYHSDDKLIVDIDQEGNILGRNVGETNITLSNSEDELKLHVVVSLFEEPTLDFGASPDEIKSIYGEPRRNYGDSIFVYGSGNNWYSWAVWEMDFFFGKGGYYESDLYLRSDLDIRIEQYLRENYFPYDTITDTLTSNNNNEEISIVYLYLNEPNPKDATVIVGKQYNSGYENQDIRLMYAPFITNSRSGFRTFYFR